MSDNLARQHARPRRIPFIAVAALAVILLVVAQVRRGAPTMLAHAHGVITTPCAVDSGWFWLEAAGSPASRIVRLGAERGREAVTADDRIGCFATAENKLAWSARSGADWVLNISSPDGAGKTVLSSGPDEPRGLCIAEGRVFWLEQTAPLVPDSGPLPPLQGRVIVKSVPITGGAPAVVATLMETEGQQVIGARGDALYVSAVRPGIPGATVIYRVSLSTGSAARIVGEAGVQREILCPNGALYWTARSPEATDSDANSCVRKLGRDERPVTLTDWLPAGGALYESGGVVYYVDGGASPAAWPISTRRALPNPLSMPKGEAVVAVGSGKIVLRPTSYAPASYSVYEMTLE